MKKKIKYLSVILAFVIMAVNTLPGTPVKVNASDLESVSENSIAELLSETATTPTESSDGTGGTEENPSGGTVTPPTEGEDSTVGSENETGKWSVKVSYDFAEGKGSEEIFVNEELVAPESGGYADSFEYQIPEILPVRDGYTFEGWSYGDAIYSAGTWITFTRESHASAEVKFVAVWRETGPWTAKISFNLNGGKETNGILEKGTEIVVQESDTAGCPDSVNYYLTQIKEIPTKENYIFKGWSCDSKIETSEAEGDYVVITRDNPQITFTAQWNELPKVTIRYVDVEGETTTEISSASVYIPADGTMPAYSVNCTTTKDYCSFAGWVCDINNISYQNGDELKDISWGEYVGKTITFTSVWEELPSVTVVYDRQDDSKNTTVPVQKKSEAKETFSISLPTDESVYEGYEFIGWKYKINDGEYSQGIYTVNDEAPVFKWADFANGGTITCEAQWIKLAEVMVTFVSEGTTYKQVTIRKTAGEDSLQITLPENNPDRAEYRFAGWKCSVDGKEYTEQPPMLSWNEIKEKNVTAITFTAQWEELPSVNVVYDRQDDSKNTTVPVKKKSEAEETFSISLPTDESVYEDYEFIGWKYKINDGEYSQGIYTVNDEAPVFKWTDFANGGTITCEAQWIKLAEVTVNFMNGTEMVNDLTIRKAAGIDSFQIYIPKVIPGKEGYVFTGWKSNLDEEKLYESGSEITGLLWSDYKEVGTITFEAQWEWDNESIFETATYPLVAGNRYYLTDGTWTVNDDGYSYTGDITFSVREDGDYTFKKN